ncbi:Rab family GTPase [Spirulina sp. 06S082]|uniref:Rab family GTPase n=1 Tax=Spirulina sp. 06S082 TaxID=3110248 RepID=UPI002B205E33|nr:Rab family GTPase [Spirulina sp. 06S082]MEA5470230.1 Rab family GTPase [Spirulina sp. 06S082]
MGKISKKICLIGDFSVGKTSLIRRFVDNQFSDEYLSTVGVKLSRKVVTLKGEKEEEKPVELLIWDIEGQTQFKSIAPAYLQGAKGAIIVADVKRQETMEHLRDHLDLFFKINPKGWVIIALNKSDLISEEKVFQLSHSNNQFQADYPQVIATYATSAKTGKDVNDLFHELAASMLVAV